MTIRDDVYLERAHGALAQLHIGLQRVAGERWTDHQAMRERAKVYEESNRELLRAVREWSAGPTYDLPAPAAQTGPDLLGGA